MKNFRKLLSLVLAVVMVCAVSTTAWAEEDGLVGAKYTLNLKRGTSNNWTFIVDNYFSSILR